MYTLKHSRVRDSQVVLYRTKENGNLPKRKSDIFNVVIGQHSVQPAVCRLDIWKKNDRGGLLYRFGGSDRRVEGRLICMRLLPILHTSGLEELQHNVEARLVAKSPGSVHQGRKNALYVGGMVV
jgi:hypothetical protein